MSVEHRIMEEVKKAYLGSARIPTAHLKLGTQLRQIREPFVVELMAKMTEFSGHFYQPLCVIIDNLDDSSHFKETNIQLCRNIFETSGMDKASKDWQTTVTTILSPGYQQVLHTQVLSEVRVRQYEYARIPRKRPSSLLKLADSPKGTGCLAALLEDRCVLSLECDEAKIRHMKVRVNTSFGGSCNKKRVADCAGDEEDIQDSEEEASSHESGDEVASSLQF
ncbi:hypothetical protein HOLleu_02923 [Holothuria leucospilota]|uniref:Uncharacterized protein n=1 Tax=Holothuria leucospilota TaxID=206669 RepID=A0A9Q1HLL1_HOLLE|nr:hypothetical protein HOLleu_02923 [Holothuria leucospilota]